MSNPFPGLRPFLKEDSYLFFGREKHIESVLSKLINNKFIAIIGNSGIGKSSFINCGILPKLYSGAIGNDSHHWDIFPFRPGSDPLKALSETIYNYYKDDELQGEIIKDSDFVKKIINTNGIEGFFDIFKNISLTSDNNFLLYVDQFEELFRHKKHDSKKTNEINEFLNIIVECAARKELPINVVITMRSDFIGECSKYPNLTTLINDSQFLIPQMTRDEKYLAITGPVKVMGAQISEDLVNDVLNKLGDADDQLPVMQHCLMRMWEYWQTNKIGNEKLTHNHYNAVGGMDSALSVHANEIFNELDDEVKPICENIFKNITEKGEEGRTIRRPASVRQLSLICVASSEKIIQIVDSFRKPGRTLLTPFTEKPLTEDSIVDVSHESIMRIWATLSKWIDDEQESVKQYLRIAEAAEMHQHGKGGLLKSPELQMAINWRNSENPNKTWGVRHHIAFDRTMEYLDFSENEFKKEERLKARNQRKRLLLARGIAGVFGFGAIVAILLFIYGLKQKEKAKIEADNAKQQEQIAYDKAMEARASEQKAKQSEEKAQLSAVEALESAEQARISAIIAKENERKALLSRKEALFQTEIANAAKDTAELAKKDAFRLRMLSIARSMAVKSLQEPEDVTKALVARQAFNFFEKYEGVGTDPDVYQALYYALKKIKGSEFNSLKGHADNVRAIVTTPTSSSIFSAGSDGRIIKWKKSGESYVFDSKIYEINSNKVLRVNKALAISSNGKWLVCGGNYQNLLLFNTESATVPKMLPTKTETRFVAFTPDNQNIIYVPNDKQIMIYNTQLLTNKVLDVATSKINSIAIDPSGNYFAIGTEEGDVVGYSLKTLFSKEVLYHDRGNLPITAISFNHTGNRLAIGNRAGNAYVMNVKSKALSSPLLGHTAKINHISFNKDGKKLATASWDHTVRVWDLEYSDVQPIILQDHNDWVWSILFSSDGTHLLAGCRDNLIRAWPLDITQMSDEICSSAKVSRKLTEKEWTNYVGEDIDLECTCNKKCR